MSYRGIGLVALRKQQGPTIMGEAEGSSAAPQSLGKPLSSQSYIKHVDMRKPIGKNRNYRGCNECTCFEKFLYRNPEPPRGHGKQSSSKRLRTSFSRKLYRSAADHVYRVEATESGTTRLSICRLKAPILALPSFHLENLLSRFFSQSVHLTETNEHRLDHPPRRSAGKLAGEQFRCAIMSEEVEILNCIMGIVTIELH